MNQKRISEVLQIADNLGQQHGNPTHKIAAKMLGDYAAMCSRLIGRVTDEMVESGCTAMAKKFRQQWPKDYDDDEITKARDAMRAALLAALDPDQNGLNPLAPHRTVTAVTIEESQVFKFDLGDRVKIAISEEHGEVIGRADYLTSESSYFIRYAAGDGRAVESWWAESALEPDNV